MFGNEVEDILYILSQDKAEREDNLLDINRPKIRIISVSLLERRLLQIPDELLILLVFFGGGPLWGGSIFVIGHDSQVLL